MFIALAVATIAGAVLSGGDDEGSSPSSADNTPAQPKADANRRRSRRAQGQEGAEGGARRQPAPAEEQADSGSYDEERGAELNDEGFRLMGAGDYEGAVPVLQEAVNSFPPDTDNLTYAYALFNLGKSLRLAGRPDEAIPILKQRLKIPNQTDEVKAELDQAKRDAGKG